MYGTETLIWKEKERSRIRAVEKDNIRDLLSSIMKMDKSPEFTEKGVVWRRKD